ncbi:hypothetical protein FF2_020116 [Malus domestica]
MTVVATAVMGDDGESMVCDLESGVGELGSKTWVLWDVIEEESSSGGGRDSPRLWWSETGFFVRDDVEEEKSGRLKSDRSLGDGE